MESATPAIRKLIGGTNVNPEVPVHQESSLPMLKLNN